MMVFHSYDRAKIGRRYTRPCLIDARQVVECIDIHGACCYCDDDKISYQKLGLNKCIFLRSETREVVFMEIRSNL